MAAKYPKIKVKLTGRSGNAFVVLGAVANAMKRGNVPASEINIFMDEAKSGDYDHLIQTCMKWVDIN